MIETPRLTLRPWRESDIAPFHAMGRDSEVMRHLGPLQSLDDARAAYDRMVKSQAEHGMCFWAIERRADARFIGFCGLKSGKPPIDAEIEIGWRLARDCWGQGYAREAAEASLVFGFDTLGLDEIVAITTPANIRSLGLMERIGMRHCPDEAFDHPELAADDPLRPHILYRLRRPAQPGASIA